MKIFKIVTATFIALGFALSGVLIAAPAAAAPSETELTKLILDELDNSSDDLVVIEPAKISNADLINDQLFSSYTSIVVVDSGSLNGYAPEELSQFILQEDGYDYSTSLNILVVNYSGEDKIYVSANNPELELAVSKILGGSSAEGPITTTDAGWEILRNSDAIYKSQRSFSDDGDTGMIVGIVFGCIFGVPLIVWGIVALILHLRRKWRRGTYARNAAKNAKRTAKNDKVKAKEFAAEQRKTDRAAKEEQAKKERARAAREASGHPLTPLLTENIAALRSFIPSLSKTDPELANSIESVLERFSELREAITLMGAGKVKREILFLEYGNTFEKLVTLVGPKYYQDIKENPTHWRNADDKLNAIRKSFESTNDQLLESIIQLKEGSELEFQVSIDSILGFKIYSVKDMLE